MEGNSNGSSKKEGEARQEGESSINKQINGTIGMEVLDCPVCSKPLSPPIFQCSRGHFLCWDCRDESLAETGSSACGVCSRAIVGRCYGVERLVDSIVVPCSYAEHGCTDKITYYRKGEHEEACPHAPCFCPEKGCGFAGTTAALLDHFTAQHKWPVTGFRYYVPFDVPVKAGAHVLREDGGDVFLLNVALPASALHAISLVRVQPHDLVYRDFKGCSVGFSWFRGHYQVSTLHMVRSTSLSDGLPTDYFCFVPAARCGGGSALRVTLDTAMVYNSDDDELEEEDDDDNSYDELEVQEEEDDDDELEEEDDDDNSYDELEVQEEDDDSYVEEDDNDKVGDSDKEDD